MTRPDLPAGAVTAVDLIEEMKQDDPAFRKEWERTAFARDVAIALIRYRATHGLDQAQLAQRLGLEVETVSELEEGEDDLEIAMLRLLAERLGLRFALDIHPGPSTGVEVIHSVA